MKADEIRNLSDADIRARVQELEEERFRLRFRAATETLEQPLRLRSVRRDIARLQTILRERAIQAQPARPVRPARPAQGGTKGRKASSAATAK